MTRLFSFVVCFVCIGAMVSAETVQTAERTFRLRHRDGVVELYKVRWTASREMTTTERGTPAKPFEGIFIDTRKCEWNINGGITRTVSLLAKNGKEFITPDKTKVFNSDFRNEGTSFDLSTGRPGNCNDTAARRNSDFADVHRALLAALDATVEHDFAVVKREFQTDGATVEPM
jgi:hypothetical protein